MSKKRRREIPGAQMDDDNGARVHEKPGDKNAQGEVRWVTLRLPFLPTSGGSYHAMHLEFVQPSKGAAEALSGIRNGLYHLGYKLGNGRHVHTNPDALRCLFEMAAVEAGIIPKPSE